MPADTPHRSADICQRLLRGYQFSPSDLSSDDLGPLYRILDERFAWFQAHLAAVGFPLVRDGEVVLLEKEQKEQKDLTGEERQVVVALFLLGVRDRINSLQRLKPLIDQWTAAAERYERAVAHEQTTRLRLVHAARRFVELLEDQCRDLGGRHAALNSALAALDAERQQLADTLAEAKGRDRELSGMREELQNLTQRCAGHQQDVDRAECERLIYEAKELENRVNQTDTASIEKIEQRLRRVQAEHGQILRQIESRTISHLLAEADLSDEQRALVRFLIAERLLSLPLAEAVPDPAALLAAARATGAHIGAEGVFHGFGLAIARNVWYRTSADEEPLADRLADCKHRIANHEQDLAIARNREQAQQQIRERRRQVADFEERLTAFQRLEELEAHSGGADAITRELGLCRQYQQELKAQQQPLTERVKAQQQDQVDIKTALHKLEQQQKEVRQVRADIGEVHAACPEAIATLSDSDLPEFFQQSHKHHREQRSELRRSSELGMRVFFWEKSRTGRPALLLAVMDTGLPHCPRIFPVARSVTPLFHEQGYCIKTGTIRRKRRAIKARIRPGKAMNKWP